ncbi:MAG: low temperature requirement protein A [bacterium]
MSAPAATPGRVWRRRMQARDATVEHRASTDLELLFDLTFVVAVAAVSTALAHQLAAGQIAHGVGLYLMTFFAIWWAWVNFTWFASAFDTDDVPYRLLTLVQMAGVLVLAAGVKRAFEDSDFTVIVVGYVIMRLAMVGQWLRAAAGDPAFRITCLRYAAGVSLVQLAWIARMALPADVSTASFVLLAAAEVIVPVWAERGAMTTWHPRHIGERYGLFTIIVLGEGIAQVGNAFAAAVDGHITVNLITTAVGGIVLLFALWWIYFARPVGDQLRDRRSLAFVWGYGHLLVFASLAAMAAALEVSIEAVGGHAGGGDGLAISDLEVALAIGMPVAVFLLVHGLLVRALDDAAEPPLPAVFASAAATVLLALTGAVLPLPVAGSVMCLPAVAVVVYLVASAHQRAVRARLPLLREGAS